MNSDVHGMQDDLSGAAGVSAELATVSYAMFAFQQPIGITDLRSVVEYGRLRPMQPQAPTWFAAAANDSASLLETAPELLAGLGNDSRSVHTSVARDSDIIGIYAPETRREVMEPVAVAPVSSEGEPSDEVLTPRTSIQMGLLRELADLDL